MLSVRDISFGRVFGLLKADVRTGNRRVGKAGNRVLICSRFQGCFQLRRSSGHCPDRQIHRLASNPLPGGQRTCCAGDPALNGVQLRGVIGANPGAVTTTETGFGILQHRAIFRMLGIGFGRAAFHAHRVITVVAGHGNIHALEVGIRAAFDIAHGSEKVNARGCHFLGAGRFTGVAADTVVCRKSGNRAACCGWGSCLRWVAIDFHGTACWGFGLGDINQRNQLSITVGVSGNWVR